MPTVDVSDLKAVWSICRDIEQKHPGKQVGVCTTLIESVCSPGAGNRAVMYRGGMLQILEIACGDLLNPMDTKWAVPRGHIQGRCENTDEMDGNWRSPVRFPV